VSEWLIEPVSKTGVPFKGTAGSNPALSVTPKKTAHKLCTDNGLAGYGKPLLLFFSPTVGFLLAFFTNNEKMAPILCSIGGFGWLCLTG
jgi:hypothetical protein